MDIALILISMNVLAFVLPYIFNFSKFPFNSHDSFLQLGWKDNSAIKDGEWYRLLSSNFLHADFWHLLFNMYALFNLSPIVTSIFRPWGFLLIYLLSGISGSLFSFWFNSNPSIGASGAIFGLVGALVAYAILNQDFSLLSQLILIVVINVGYGFLNTQIDNFGHLGGFVAGFGIAFGLLTYVF
jgi:rhomboid protease GluP